MRREKPGGDTGGTGGPKWPKGYPTPQNILPRIKAGQSYPEGPVWHGSVGGEQLHWFLPYYFIIFHYCCIFTLFLIIKLFLSQPTRFTLIPPHPTGLQKDRGNPASFLAGLKPQQGSKGAMRQGLVREEFSLSQLMG